MMLHIVIKRELCTQFTQSDFSPLLGIANEIISLKALIKGGETFNLVKTFIIACIKFLMAAA